MLMCAFSRAPPVFPKPDQPGKVFHLDASVDFKPAQTCRRAFLFWDHLLFMSKISQHEILKEPQVYYISFSFLSWVYERVGRSRGTTDVRLFIFFFSVHLPHFPNQSNQDKSFSHNSLTIIDVNRINFFSRVNE